MSEQNEYNLTFSAEGNMSVMADSLEDANRQAVEAIQCLDMMDAVSVDIEGCSVKVTGQFTDDGYKPIDSPSRCVEFAS